MAITKQYLKTKPVCKVTFTVPAETAKEVTVVGSFNEWNAEETPLKKLKNGTFKGTVDLERTNLTNSDMWWMAPIQTTTKLMLMHGTIMLGPKMAY